MRVAEKGGSPLGGWLTYSAGQIDHHITNFSIYLVLLLPNVSLQ
jgi:hypothetical protein